MSNIRRPKSFSYILQGLILFSLVACFENSILEQPRILGENSGASISVVEITDINLFTYFDDSIATNKKTNFLLGLHNDPLRGEIYASPYLQFGISSAIQIQEDAELDSVSLVLFYDYYHYDTLPEFSISIYELAENPDQDKDGLIYGFDQFNHHASPITTRQVQALPHKDSLTITIPYSWGERLFEMTQTNSSVFSNSSNLTEIFHGFLIKPESEGPILSFTNESYMAFHYKTPQHLDRTNSNFKLYMNADLNSFTHIRGLRNSGIYQDTPYFVNISSKTTDGTVVVDPLLKACVRIEFPTILSVKELSEFYYISDAFLRLPVARGSYDDKFNLPAISVDVHIIDRLNRPVASVGNFQITSFDSQFQEYTYYTLPIKPFIDVLMELNSDVGYALYLVIQDDSLLNSNYVMFKSNSSNQKISLQITYIPLN